MLKMMRKYVIILAALLVMMDAKGQKLSKAWEVANLQNPESVVFYKKHYYVSNVAGQPTEKNGEGFITQIDENGKIVNQKWAVGFDAPKGLGVYQNTLYVADIDKVMAVSLETGKTIATYKAPGATFLNDVEISKGGTVYISDTFGGNAIYQIKEGKISMWLKDEALDYPNGLKIVKDKVYVASWGVVTNPQTFGTKVPGRLLEVSLKTKQVRQVSPPNGNLDGIVAWKKQFLVSDWIEGNVKAIDKMGNSKQLIDLPAGSADINLVKEKQLLLVPEMGEGKLSAYKIR